MFLWRTPHPAQVDMVRQQVQYYRYNLAANPMFRDLVIWL
jgi:hypothetical protein